MENQTPQQDPGKGLGIAGLVLGIASLVIPYAGILTAIVGLVLSIIGKNKSAEVGLQNGMAKAGMICSIIALAWSIVLTILCVSCVAVGSTYGGLNGLF
jgi:hypothetical protein